MICFKSEDFSIAVRNVIKQEEWLEERMVRVRKARMEFRRYITNWKAPNMDVVRGFGLMVTWVDFGTFAGLVGLWGGTGGGGIFEDGVAKEGSSQGNSG